MAVCWQVFHVTVHKSEEERCTKLSVCCYTGADGWYAVVKFSTWCWRSVIYIYCVCEWWQRRSSVRPWNCVSRASAMTWHKCIKSHIFWINVMCLWKYVEIKCQLDATEVFIADLIACSTCFGHHYAHHQELKSIYTVVAACGIWCCGFQVAGLVWSWGLCVRFAGRCSMLSKQ